MSNRQLVVDLLSSGLSPKEVAEQTGVSTGYVYYVRKQFGKGKKKPSKPAKAKVPESVPDMVNHPPHYTVGGIETADFIAAKNLSYNLGNVVKYVSRAKYKGSMLQDLQKALWYLQREIELTDGSA